MKMAKTREVACENYICEGNCAKGRSGEFRGQCQHCDLYVPIKGGRPRRKDLRQEKKEKFDNDRRNWE